jgi:hypothetical protein
MKNDARQVLAENVRKILAAEASNPNAWSGQGGEAFKKKVQRACNGGNATIETLDAIATRAGLHAWQLLIPGLDPANPPVFVLTETERKLYASIKRAADALPPVASQ